MFDPQSMIIFAFDRVLARRYPIRTFFERSDEDLYHHAAFWPFLGITDMGRRLRL